MPVVISPKEVAGPIDPAQRRSARRRMVFSGCLLLILLLLMLGLQSNYVPSISMKPNLKPGDHILTMRAWMVYPGNVLPSRGDIIVFRVPKEQLDKADALNGGASGHSEGVEILIKRVVGIPGDRVLMRGNTVLVNNIPLQEEYAVLPMSPASAYATTPYATAAPLIVQEGQVFVLGDNRGNSEDSRYWGTLRKRDILGRFLEVLYNEGAHGLNANRGN